MSLLFELISSTVMLTALILLLLNLRGAANLKICSFNIQSFGESKISKTDVLDIIVEVSFLFCMLFNNECTMKKCFDAILKVYCIIHCFKLHCFFMFECIMNFIWLYGKTLTDTRLGRSLALWTVDLLHKGRKHQSIADQITLCY